MAAISWKAVRHVTTWRKKERAGEHSPRAPARALKAPAQTHSNERQQMRVKRDSRPAR